MTADAQQRQSIAEKFGAEVAARLFESRKGHGGGPCSYLQMTETDLAHVVTVAFESGAFAAAEAAKAVGGPA